MNIQAILNSATTSQPHFIGRTFPILDPFPSILPNRQAYATPGVVLAYGKFGSDSPTILHSGFASIFPEVTSIYPDSLFDLASLTKAYVATLTAILVERNILSWTTPLSTFIDISNGATLLDLLDHRAGFAAWHKFYEDYTFFPLPNDITQRKSKLLATASRYLRSPNEIAQKPHEYSDIGYILLGFILEEVSQKSLNNLIHDEICIPLNLSNTFFPAITPIEPTKLPRVAATEWSPRRHQWMRGQVHDENCDIFGGVTGHAGLFSTAGDTYTFLHHILGCYLGQAKDPLVSQETLHFLLYINPDGRPPSHRGGWDMPTGTESSVGRGLSNPHTFGHLGFTGTSFWANTSSKDIIVLLTNRVHPSRENPLIKPFRIAVHEAIVPPIDPPNKNMDK